MAYRVYPLTITVPAGTLQSAPQLTPWNTEDNTIVSIEVEIPPGHNGQTGIRFMKGDVQFLPYGSNSWIIANDTDKTFPIDDYVPTIDLIIQAYNTGVYSHNFYLRMTVADYTPPAPSQSASTVGTLPIETATPSTDPLSPDAILGPGTAAALASGDVTAADVAPVDLTAQQSSVT